VIKNLYRKRLRRLLGDESGFSLMEVIVAIAIMTIVATAAASLSFNGVATSTAEERQQVATTVANAALEKVSGWSTAVDSGTGVISLYDGRGKAAVQAAFAANSTRPGVAQTVAAWDTSLGSGSTSNGVLPTVTPDPNALPAAAPFIQNGTKYTVTTLIGTCYEQPAPSTTTAPIPPDNCVSTAGATPTTLIRVIVIVKWTAGAKCVVNGCYFQASTILDPNADLEWITH
jgi:prepilin-type N-terminal cleavage/methylation domain-containing protein